MKTLSISLYNRPKYTKILFDHLDQCFGNFGVKKAVQEFMNHSNIGELLVTNEPIWKSWYFYKK